MNQIICQWGAIVSAAGLSSKTPLPSTGDPGFYMHLNRTYESSMIIFPESCDYVNIWVP